MGVLGLGFGGGAGRVAGTGPVRPRAPDPGVRLSHSAVPDEAPSLESFLGLES
jgi:hypothetical protein